MFGLIKDLTDIVTKPIEVVVGGVVKPMADLAREVADELSPYEND